ncbi:hypothetical protein XFEB_01006 [Xylella fastidiosa EB92.1]|nr:hypothetical protein XFEB_01006 [Xylella fastidiosa EB92.1]
MSAVAGCLCRRVFRLIIGDGGVTQEPKRAVTIETVKRREIMHSLLLVLVRKNLYPVTFVALVVAEVDADGLQCAHG